MAVLYECGTWQLTLNGVELLGLSDYTAGRPFNLPAQNHGIQVDPFVRGRGVDIFDRGNISHGYRLTVVREEATETAARAAMAAHLIALQDIGDGNAVMVHTDGTGVVYEQAALSDAEPLHSEEDIGNARFWGMTYSLQLGRAEKFILTADSTFVTADSTNITADAA